MKLLFINSEYPPVGAGAGNATANLARILVKAGHEVVVVTTSFDGLAPDEQREGVRIIRGPAKRRLVDRSTALEQALFIAGASYRSLRLLGEFKPDAVLAFFGLPSGAAAWMLKGLFGIPYVVSLRGGDVPGFRPYDFWLYHKIAVPALRLIWRGASAVVANSAGLRDLASAFYSKVDIDVIPNGVELGKYARKNPGLGEPRILSVGRVVHQKGLDTALAALAELRDLKWQWRIAGDGPQLLPLRQEARARGLESRVRFLGWQGTEALVAEYAQADLFLFPSRHEGMPNAVLEAMASSLPVVATRIAGNEELVEDGRTGILVRVEDAAGLREALRCLLTDEDRRHAMGREGRARVEHGYGWEAAATKYAKVLERAAQ